MQHFENESPEQVMKWPNVVKVTYEGLMKKEDMDEDGYAWEFAYGSNMNDKIFKVRRGLTAVEQEQGIIKDWRLTMGHGGIPFAEPAFGDLEPCPGSEIHGIMHKISYDDFIKLQKTEGGGGSQPGYYLIKLKAQSYNGQEREVWALKTHANCLESVYTPVPQFPSNRYMDIIREGAKQKELKEDYQKFLEQYEVNDTGKKPLMHKISKFILSIIFMFVITSMTVLTKTGLTTSFIGVLLMRIYNFLLKTVAWKVYNILPSSTHQLNYTKIHHSKLIYTPGKSNKDKQNYQQQQQQENKKDK